MDLLAHGRSTSEIAERLAISPTAVRVHIASIVRKLEVPTEPPPWSSSAGAPTSERSET
jgi:DNA-binding NarL/FixJ family response regulator